MIDARDKMECPRCGTLMGRIYEVVPDVWHTDGAHKTDYGSGNHTGTKADALNKAWGSHYNEPPPPPAPEVPKNGSETY